MKVLDRYTIHFAGLTEGNHHFDFTMDDAFWAAFENSDIKHGTAEVSIDMARSRRLLVLDIAIKGSVSVECDRCLDDLEVPVNYEGTLGIKFSEDVEDSYDGDVMWLSPSEGEVNLAQHLYESVLLSLPYRRIHGENGNNQECNPDMMARFGIISQDEFDSIGGEEETMGERPEGEALRKLKEQLEK